jgi:hypothetical protein
MVLRFSYGATRPDDRRQAIPHRLYATYGVPAGSKSKRLELAQAAINSGVIGRHRYR